MNRRRSAVAFLVSMLAVTAAWADGSLSGQVTAPAGTPMGDIRIVLIPEKAGIARRTIKLNKKNVFFFGLVPEGKYTLGVEGTPLVPTAIALTVYDTDVHKEVLKYNGASPSAPQSFDVSINLKVTYDITLGQAAPSGGASPGADVPAMLQAGDYQGALAKIDTALAGKPDDANLHYLKGFALFRMKDMEKATVELKRSLELNPAQTGAHWVTGAILVSTGKKPEAVAEFQKEVDLPDTDAATRLNSYINIGVLERDLGNRERAIAAFEKVLELDNQQSEAYSYLADLYLATGKPDKAEEIQTKGRALGIEDPKAVFNVGATQWNNKEFAKAEASFRRAVELDPKFALAWKHLGYALVNLDKKKEASAALKKYLELAPDAADAKEVRELVGALGSS